MGRNSHFQFKQFTVQQGNAAMKVGTDGVLLGVWANTEKINSVLDIGTGTGLIALMMAQRSKATITAIEIEENAFRDAFSNIQNSLWSERIKVVHSSFQEYLKNNSQLFDCIVCNPPYFTNSIKSKKESRTIARHNDELPFEALIEGVSRIINKEGHFSVVLPTGAESDFRYLAANFRLFPSRITRVKPKPSKPVSRVLIEFRFEATLKAEDELTIETETHHEYLPGFIELVKDFYLKL
jgi:tRNA1Val (adenine37-N6)-methyltransferase